MRFQIGDSVVGVGRCDGMNVDGLRGVICTTTTADKPGVRFDNRLGGFHTCAGKCDDHHGFYVYAKNLILDNENEFASSQLDFENFLNGGD